jgi:hypothetical protein
LKAEGVIDQPHRQAPLCFAVSRDVGIGLHVRRAFQSTTKGLCRVNVNPDTCRSNYMRSRRSACGPRSSRTCHEHHGSLTGIDDPAKKFRLTIGSFLRYRSPRTQWGPRPLCHRGQ